jgi:hypothetical protein
MVQCGSRASLANESLESFVVEAGSLGENLQDELALEERIACAVDLSHAARADAGDYLVSIDGASSRECVRLRHDAKQT